MLSSVVTCAYGDVGALVRALTSESADDSVSGPRRRRRRSLAERARRAGVRPVESLDAMACDLFASDEEVDEFIEFVRAERQAGLR